MEVGTLKSSHREKFIDREEEDAFDGEALPFQIPPEKDSFLFDRYVLDGLPVIQALWQHHDVTMTLEPVNSIRAAW